MDERSILINTARSRVVDIGALIKALAEGRIAAAGQPANRVHAD